VRIAATVFGNPPQYYDITRFRNHTIQINFVSFGEQSLLDHLILGMYITWFVYPLVHSIERRLKKLETYIWELLADGNFLLYLCTKIVYVLPVHSVNTVLLFLCHIIVSSISFLLLSKTLTVVIIISVVFSIKHDVQFKGLLPKITAARIALDIPRLLVKQW
jgi:hypothetical protein